MVNCEETKEIRRTGKSDGEREVNKMLQSHCSTDSEKEKLIFQLNDKADYIETELEKARTILNDLYTDYLAPVLTEKELHYYQDHARTLCEIVDDYLIRADHLLQELHIIAGYPVTD